MQSISNVLLLLWVKPTLHPMILQTSVQKQPRELLKNQSEGEQLSLHVLGFKIFLIKYLHMFAVPEMETCLRQQSGITEQGWEQIALRSPAASCRDFSLVLQMWLSQWLGLLLTHTAWGGALAYWSSWVGWRHPFTPSCLPRSSVYTGKGDVFNCCKVPRSVLHK